MDGQGIAPKAGFCDVRDFGARGDGLADDGPALAHADARADGRPLLLPPGTYRVARPLVLRSPVAFQGRMTATPATPVILCGAFDLPTYAAAFGSLTEGLRRGLQALLCESAPRDFDMRGLTVPLSAPLAVSAPGAQPRRRRSLRGGTIRAEPSALWEPSRVTAVARRNASAPATLSVQVGGDVIPVGALIEGPGLGPEVHVTTVGPDRITLSHPPSDAAGDRSFSLTRHRYLLDLFGCAGLCDFEITDVTFDCAGRASGLLLPPDGSGIRLTECRFDAPRDRAITAPGARHRALTISRCAFAASEDPRAATGGRVIALSAGGPETTLRDCRMSGFRHAAVISGPGVLLEGTEIVQAEGAPDEPRSAGLVLARAGCHGTVAGCSFENAGILWTDALDDADGAPFSGLALTGNVFTSSDADPDGAFLVIAPQHPARGLSGVAVTGNTFRALGLGITRAERVDDRRASLDLHRARDVTFAGNVFRNVACPGASPCGIRHSQDVPADTWVVDADGQLPFGCPAGSVGSVVFTSRIRNEAEASEWAMPYVSPARSGAGDKVHVIFPERVRGNLEITVRLD